MDRDPGSRPAAPMEKLLYEVKKVIVGQDHLLERMVVALLARGHLLVEGVPGLAKTMAVKTLAQAIGGEFKRIQFTPDLVPADLVGTRIYNQKTGEFTTSLGPVFTNLLLADEINRAPAKVQSALLEVMQERQVTIGHETHTVPDPFLVLATQNPIETEGTYALPEAQVDRFMLKVVVDYPTPAEEFAIVERMTGRLDAVQQVLSTGGAGGAAAGVDRVYVDPALFEYAVRLSSATRTPRAYGMPDLERYITYGASPRASINLILTGPRPGLRPRPRVRAPAGRPRHGRATSCATGSCSRSRRSRTTSRSDAILLGTILGRVPPPVVPLQEPIVGVRRRRLSACSSASTGRSSGAWTACSRATTAACSAAPGSTWPRCASTSPGDDVRRHRLERHGPDDDPARPRVPRGPRDHRLVPARPEPVRGLRHGRRRARRSGRQLVDFTATLARLLTRRGNRVGAMLFASKRRPDDPGRGRPRPGAAARPRPAGRAAPRRRRR